MQFKNRRIVYIGYATLNTPYTEVMNTQLLPSLNKFKLPKYIKYIEDKGNWNRNTNYKSKFILEALEENRCDVVFLDADATILKFPKLFYEIPRDYDMGAHYLDWFKMWRKVEGNPKREFLSGTLYIKYNKKMINLIKEFITEIDKNPKEWEQRTMQKVLEKHNDIKTYNLPYSYITFPLQDGNTPIHMVKEEDVVIYHSQASRKFKKRSKK